MSREQRSQYIELGKMCQDCELSAVERDKERERAAAAAGENVVISPPPPAPAPVPAPVEKKPKKGYIKKADRVPNSK